MYKKVFCNCEKRTTIEAETDNLRSTTLFYICLLSAKHYLCIDYGERI